MEKQDNILTKGTLFWIKAGNRGSVPIPLELLSEEQKQTLRSGLENNQYPLDVPLRTLNARYIWVNEYGFPEVQVTNIDLSPEIKRKLRPIKKTYEKREYRLTLTDMSLLQRKFLSGEVDNKYVQDILNNIIWRPEQYAEWESTRNLKIENSCENCGKTTNLVLQHTKQPRTFNKIVYELVGANYEAFQIFMEQKINEIELPLDKNIKKVPVCPKCGSSRVRYRMRKNNYVCEKSRDRVICKYEFTEPQYGYDEGDILRAEKKRKSQLRDMFCHEHNLYQKSTEISLEEIIEYLNMEHVKTLCNKCAFIEDKPYNKL